MLPAMMPRQSIADLEAESDGDSQHAQVIARLRQEASPGSYAVRVQRLAHLAFAESPDLFAAVPEVEHAWLPLQAGRGQDRGQRYVRILNQCFVAQLQDPPRRGLQPVLGVDAELVGVPARGVRVDGAQAAELEVAQMDGHGAVG